MSKTVKSWMIRDYKESLSGVEDALLISIRGIPANENNGLRVDLRNKDIRITVIRNNLARHALKDTSLGLLEPLLEGPSALAYGAESVVDVARALVDWSRKLELLELKGAVLEGQLYAGRAGVEALSRLPTREEALANNVTLILSPGRKLLGQITGPGGSLMGVVKAIEEKLEKGETISRVG